MIFNLKIKTVKEVKSIPHDSAYLEFCKNNNEFEKIIKLNNLEISKTQKENFKKEKEIELRIWKSKTPELFIIKKVDNAKKINTDYFRNYLSGTIQSLEKLNLQNLFVKLPVYKNYKTEINNDIYFYQTFVEGIYLGNYNFNKFKSEKKKSKILNVSLIHGETANVNKAVRIGNKLIESVYFARDLVNEPANVLTPQELAGRVKKTFRNTKVKVKIFDEKELTKRKMNAILNVGKGSVNKPKLIILHYKPTGKIKKKIALVGKGLTYDTGGLSLKPTDSMLEMKADMAGSATVFGVMQAAEKLKLPYEIIAIVPAVENAIGGNSYRPGDIISTASGKTIEVKNTDAEGRIVLADALEYASKQKPDEIIDFATLTGAAVVALGEFTAAIFSKNDNMANNLFNAGQKTFERVWRLPFWDEYNKLLDSKIADVSNLGPRWGGAITAGKFLEHFVDEKIPWTHVDLAGPAMKNDLTNYTKNYCTGFGVRLIIDYLS